MAIGECICEDCRGFGKLLISRFVTPSEARDLGFCVQRN
jgi:hypothetical protein